MSDVIESPSRLKSGASMSMKYIRPALTTECGMPVISMNTTTAGTPMKTALLRPGRAIKRAAMNETCIPDTATMCARPALVISSYSFSS